jgi:mono/diheme cytochrome c family protein
LSPGPAGPIIRAGKSVTSFPRVPKVVRIVLLVLPLLFGLAVLPGCDTSNSYSEDLRFPVRTDPVLLDTFPQEPRVEPDRPGQLPLLSVSQLPKVAPLFPEGSAKDVKVLDPTKLSETDRETFQDTLEKIFGTPAQPHLKLKGTAEARKILQLDDKLLATGSRYYRVQCMHCHGLTGDGRGPTAPWVNPHPRDYRLGLFKFQSADQTDGTQRHPLRSDLLRTLEHGVEGTAMPAFNMLSLHDRESLASYVILLSLRGETEGFVFKDALEEKDGQLKVKSGHKIATDLQRAAVAFAGRWVESQTKPIDAGAFPKYSDEKMKASVERGQALFAADAQRLKELFPQKTEAQLKDLKAVSCASCHIDYGRQAMFKFDSWGTMVRPANLTTGIYRGGRRPIDLYWRIHSGINGSGMNIFGSLLSADEIWDLVNFVQAMPYPRMLKDRYGIDIH